jgi:rRNA maturation protein Nop10
MASRVVGHWMTGTPRRYTAAATSVTKPPSAMSQGGRWGGPFMGVLSLGTLGAVVCFRPRRGVLAGIILRHATCPDCGYRLAETQPAFPPAECLGVWFGPRACPECGSAWPMIPPPVFDAGV